MGEVVRLGKRGLERGEVVFIRTPTRRKVPHVPSNISRESPPFKLSARVCSFAIELPLQIGAAH